MKLNNYTNTPSFNGITKIYAMTDSHQETRKTCCLLSKVLTDSKGAKNILFLNCGDIYKGIYPRELERSAYLKMKQSNPDIEMVMTLGNNDFGFNQENLNYLIDTIKEFKSKGIQTVCANIFTKEGKRPDWVKPYTVVERDGNRTFVTGFCIDNINTSKFGIIPKKQTEVLSEIKQAILEEKPDNVVILNHNHLPASKSLVQECKDRDIPVDVLIGGHDHEYVPPIPSLNIYYPKAFSNSIYRMSLENKDGLKTLKDVEAIENQGLKMLPVFEKDIVRYEKESGLMNKIAPAVLNLDKKYSHPSSLGSFLADEMKRVSDSDIGFFSTGFLMYPMRYTPNGFITNYSFKKTIIAETPIKIVELNSKELKEVFNNAMMLNGYSVANPKFLQCSNNIKLCGRDNPDLKKWEVKQIFINDEPILDENAEPINLSKKYKCAIDSYIADGGQGFGVIKEVEKKEVVKNGEPVKINSVLLEALKEAPKKYPIGLEYPSFEICEI